ncbi:MAG: hypothetical protein RLZ98_118 [Pseudomonadota bacterium]|jgi:carbon-monoxide dehydrogenase medium subunit
MKPAAFVYHAPPTLDEALSVLAAHGDEARVLAGGQSLVPAMALRMARPAHIVDINRIAGLDRLTSSDSRIGIGATVRHAHFHDATALGASGPLLAEVARHIAHYPIRQRGTFCGSLAHADPSSEWCLVASTFDGVVTAASQGGTRQIAIGDYFQGIMTTALEPGEMLTEVGIAPIGTETRWAFEEFSMRAGDFAVAMALIAYDTKDGRIANARVGVGGVEAFPRRIPEAEGLLDGNVPTADLFTAAAEAVAGAVDPLGDWQADQEERRRLAAALVRRTLASATEGAHA